MYETSKSLTRRLQDQRFTTRWLVGEGIDIGCGDDFLGAYKTSFPSMTSIRPWNAEQGDLQTMAGVPDAFFDFVHVGTLLPCMESPLEALRHWMRILKPQGHLIVTVPDEDLYEQGVFPSSFNSEHRWTFTLYKQQSWSGERSLNVLELLASLGPEADVRKVEIVDHLFRYQLERCEQTNHPYIESCIEFVVRKRPYHEVARGGRLPANVKRPTTARIVLNCNGTDFVIRKSQDVFL